MDLKFKDDKIKAEYFRVLKEHVKIPVCYNCKKLFPLGFPNTEEGLQDSIICDQNDLLCKCEYYRIVSNIFKQKNDGTIDITPYYEKH